jgi:2-aminoadipate transaminase
MTMKWDELYAARARWMKDSITMDFRRILADPEMISFFAGLPDPELYPVEDIKTALDHVLAEDGRGALQYAPPVGYGPLKTYLAEKLRKAGVPAKEENMLILSGSIQGLDLVAEMLLDPGDTVMVEDPTFSGAVEVFDKYGAEYAVIPVDDEGLQVDILPDVLKKQRAKFMYLMPNCHNPTGVDLSVPRRRRLLEISHEFGLPLVTDDPYGELLYKGEPLPHLRALDGEANVIMISSFSKILAPGLRLGWLLAPDQVVEKLRLEKLTADRSTNHLAQRLASEMGQRGMLARYLQTMIATYGQKLGGMLTAMQEHFPSGVKWTEPRGGYFVWVTLPQGLDARLLLEKALAEKVAFMPGALFFARGGGENTLRLCFVNTQLELIPEGIRRLGQVIRQMR